MLLNEVEDRVKVAQGEAEAMGEGEADMVLANLHSQVIDALLRQKRSGSNRWIVLSGLFHGHVDGILPPLEKYRLKVHDKIEENSSVWLVKPDRRRGYPGKRKTGKLANWQTDDRIQTPERNRHGNPSNP